MSTQALRLAPRGAKDVYTPEAVYVAGGREHQVDFSSLVDVPLEFGSPVRAFNSWQHRRNYAGSYWSTTVGRHLVFESFTERTALMALDRDPSVVGIASQPVRIHWPRGHEPRLHTPDFFLRHADGDGELVDVRPATLIDKTAAASFGATRLLCEGAGLRYRVISDITQAFTQNLRFLSRYRRAAFALPPERRAALSAVAGRRCSLRELAALLSEGASMPEAIGWVCWLVWVGLVQTDLEVILSMESPAHVVEEVVL